MTRVIPDRHSKPRHFQSGFVLNHPFKHGEEEVNAGARSGPKPLGWKEYVWVFRQQPSLNVLPIH